MTAAHGDDDRDLIPRWREFGDAVRGGELDSLSARPQSINEGRTPDTFEAAHAFRQAPGIHTASDLLSQVVIQAIPHSPDGDAAARYVTDNGSPAALTDLAKLYLLGDAFGQEEAAAQSHSSLDHLIARSGKLRAILRDEPRNAIRWTDLALSQVNLGRTERAERSVRTALAPQPSNRFVVRSAIRLFVHIERPDFAHQLASRANQRSDDPWLRAAFLATARLSREPLPSLRPHRRILESGDFSPWHLSELAGQMATMEFESGDVRRAKKSMRRALLDPTENALAQAEWAAGRGLETAEVDSGKVPLSFEARARAASGSGKFREAIDAGQAWHDDQAFDPSPGVFLSYLASIALEDYATAERAARQGLIANPFNRYLRNNLVFALANQGRVAEARSHLEQLRRLPSSEASDTVTATKGLVAFREGNPEQGRKLYSAAVEGLTSRAEPDVAALAQIFWAREEIRLKTPDALTLANRAIDLALRSRNREVALWRGRLVHMVRDSDIPFLTARTSGHPALPAAADFSHPD